MPELSARHERMVTKYVAEYEAILTNEPFAEGYRAAWKAALGLLYPSVEAFFAEDPVATEYTCRAIAIERVAEGLKVPF